MSTILLLLLAFGLAALIQSSIDERLAGATAGVRGVPIVLVVAGFLSASLVGVLSANRNPGTLAAVFAVVSLAFVLVPKIKRRKANPVDLVTQIDRLLPQTQCGQCGYPGCKPYATAIANGEADINQCPPGGEAGVKALARLLGREFKALNPANGVEKPNVVALIREPECIGCTKCIQACPVDAIIGAPKSMHVVIADLCTGCELCIPPCPVDCIDLIAAE